MAQLSTQNGRFYFTNFKHLTQYMVKLILSIHSIRYIKESKEYMKTKGITVFRAWSWLISSNTSSGISGILDYNGKEKKKSSLQQVRPQ